MFHPRQIPKAGAILICLAAAAIQAASPLSASAQGLRGQEKAILDLTRANWVHFRDFNGRQLIYFTHLEVYRCGILQVRYGLNGGPLDRIYELQPCDEARPNEVTTDRPYLSLPLGTAESISILLTFEDGTESAVVTQSPVK